jgi:ABC-type antimicrobial peptide transport system permease subunit
MVLSNGPTTELTNGGGFDWTGRSASTQNGFGVVAVTQDYGKTIGWTIKDGRDFSREFSTDSSALVLNETAVRVMGLKHPVGSTIKYLGTSYKNNNFHVIGVIQDIVMESPFSSVPPTVYTMDTAATNSLWMTLRLNPSMSETKAASLIGPVFRKYNPGSPFDYLVNDKQYALNFVLEDRISILTSIFAGFAILISCLGLFGLASFTAEQRTREIGIRKVLGAPVLHLWGLLSKEFLLLVSLSFLIAIPLSYYFMHNWLQHYEYRIAISAWIFLVTMAGALLITLATVSVQSVRASLANPVKSLRTE